MLRSVLLDLKSGFALRVEKDGVDVDGPKPSRSSSALVGVAGSIGPNPTFDMIDNMLMVGGTLGLMLRRCSTVFVIQYIEI